MNIISVEFECIFLTKKEMIELHKETNTIDLDNRPTLQQLNLRLIELI